MSIETSQILAQSSPAATTATTLYTAGTKTQTVISTLFVCNSNASDQTFRVHVVPSGGSAAQTNALFYNCAILANNTTAITCGITLRDGESLVVYSSATNINYHLFGVEITPK